MQYHSHVRLGRGSNLQLQVSHMVTRVKTDILAGVSIQPFGMSGPHWKEELIVLGHTLNTQKLMKTDEQKKVVSKFTILCWATFIAILGHMGPAGCGLDTLGLGDIIIIHVSSKGTLNDHRYKYK